MLINMIFCVSFVVANNREFTHKDAVAFQKEISALKYDFYKYLDSLSYDNHRSYPYDSIINKTEVFLTFNRQRIKAFRVYQLRQNTDYEIESDNLIKQAGLEIPSTLRKYDYARFSLKDDNFAHYNLSLIAPIASVTLHHILIKSHLYGSSEMGQYSLKNIIAQPLIKTEHIEGDVWEVFVDEYDRVFRYSYNVLKGVSELLTSYNRVK